MVRPIRDGFPRRLSRARSVRAGGGGAVHCNHSKYPIGVYGINPGLRYGLLTLSTTGPGSRPSLPRPVRDVSARSEVHGDGANRESPRVLGKVPQVVA